MIGDLFAALLAGHTVGDHVVQTDYQASHKDGPWKATIAGRRRWVGVGAMLGHVGTYGLCQVAAVALVFAATGVPVPAGQVSLVTHGFIDRRWLLEHTGSARFAGLAADGMDGMYLADQALHIGFLFIAALIMGWGS